MPPVQEEKPAKSKPVVVYIMILFIAAFLLMALSFLMHQRSNTEALGQLQNSVSAMQEVQANQEKIIELQEELNDAQKALEAQEDEAKVSEEEAKGNFCRRSWTPRRFCRCTRCSSSIPPETMRPAWRPFRRWKQPVMRHCFLKNQKRTSHLPVSASSS